MTVNLTFPYQQQVCSQRRQLLDSASSLRVSRTRQLPARHYQCKCSPNWRGRGNYFANKYFIDSFIRAHKQFIPLRGLKLALQRLPVCLSVGPSVFRLPLDLGGRKPSPLMAGPGENESHKVQLVVLVNYSSLVREVILRNFSTVKARYVLVVISIVKIANII